MKNEKELKEEIEKIRGSENFDDEDFYGTLDEIGNYVYLIELQSQLKTLQERNAEVKQVIKDLNEVNFKGEMEGKVILGSKKELLQKLGLEE